MPDYQNGKIYKIMSVNCDKVYYGSTTSSLTIRMTAHKSKFKQWQNGKSSYISSFDILEAGDAEIVLVEKYPCTYQEELRAREGHWVLTHRDNCVNKLVAGNTRRDCEKQRQYYQQYYQTKRASILAQKREYHEKNKDKIRALNKVKHQCECGSFYTRKNKCMHMRTKKHKAWESAQENNVNI